MWPTDRILSGATTPCQSGPGSNGNEAVLCISQSSSITRHQICLLSYVGHSLGKSYLSTNMQSVYYTALADWAI